MSERKVSLRLGKNEPKVMSVEERRRRAAIRRLKSRSNNEKFRIQFLEKLMESSTNPRQKGYYHDEMEAAIETRRNVEQKIKQLQKVEAVNANAVSRAR